MMLRRSLILSILSVALLASYSRAETPNNGAKPAELWIISTRCAPACAAPADDEVMLSFQRLDSDGAWSNAEATDFYKNGLADAPTTFYIHGNRVDSCEAIGKGHNLFRLLQRQAGDRPFRLVIWSWPANRVYRRFRPDAQVKAARSDVQAVYLARCIRQMDAKAPVAMIGHSFGARVITGALELLAGGEIARRQLEKTTDKRPKRRLRAVLIAAAQSNASLLPGHRDGQALDEAEQMLITRNGCDRVLRWYPRLYGRGGPHALGFTGPARPSYLGENRAKVEILDLSCSVGRGHGWFDYLCAPALRCRLPWYAFLAPETPEDTPQNDAKTPETRLSAVVE